MENERQRRLRELDEEYGAYMRECDGVPFYQNNAAWSWVLVEESTYDRGTYYLTMHHVMDAAARYHDGQEYPNDWQISFLVNITTGRRYSPITVTSFEPEEE